MTAGRLFQASPLGRGLVACEVVAAPRLTLFTASRSPPLALSVMVFDSPWTGDRKQGQPRNATTGQAPHSKTGAWAPKSAGADFLWWLPPAFGSPRWGVAYLMGFGKTLATSLYLTPPAWRGRLPLSERKPPIALPTGRAPTARGNRKESPKARKAAGPTSEARREVVMIGRVGRPSRYVVFPATL